MLSDGWHAFENGQTLGEASTENGVILRDEEHPEGIRITLERDGHTPFAITCGIYGWFVHTCFFSAEAEAQHAHEAIKLELVRIAHMVPLQSDPDAEEKLPALYDAFKVFTQAFS